MGGPNLCHAHDLGERFFSGKTRALPGARGMPCAEVEPLVRDVLTVFMCTGFTRTRTRVS